MSSFSLFLFGFIFLTRICLFASPFPVFLLPLSPLSLLCIVFFSLYSSSSSFACLFYIILFTFDNLIWSPFRILSFLLSVASDYILLCIWHTPSLPVGTMIVFLAKVQLSWESEHIKALITILSSTKIEAWKYVVKRSVRALCMHNHFKREHE